METQILYLDNGGSEQLPYIKTIQEQLMFKYEIMANSDIALEPVIWGNDNVPGFLFYICEQKYYYFLPAQLNTEIIRGCLKGLFADTEHHVYTMIALPLFYQLYKLDYDDTNIVSLYDLYTIVNGEPCQEPCNIIRTVASEFEVSAKEYIPFTMQYYRNVVRKYMHRYDTTMRKELCSIIYRNHILAMSYKILNFCTFNSVYIRLNQQGQYTFLSGQITNYLFSKAGKKISVSYDNMVDNHSRYTAAFHKVLAKMYSGKLHKSCQSWVLDLTDEKLVLFVEEKSEETFMSALNHLLIKAGQQYISDIPNVRISVLE